MASSWADTAIKWASCNGNKKDCINRLWRIIENKFGPYGSTFSFVDEEWSAEFMVVTRRAVFRRGYYKAIDPTTILQFKEGNEEKVVRRLLEEEGLDHLECATRLDSQG